MTTHLMRFGTAAALVVLSSLPAFAQNATTTFNCADAAINLDGDLDGFVDADECAGLAGLTVCNGTTTRANCLDPNGRDVFVLVVPATGTNFPPDPLVYVNQVVGGLNIAAHVVAANYVGADRTLLAANSTQKVIRLTESKLTGNGVLGYCEWGTPNELDSPFVYTERAKAVAASMGLNAVDVIKWVINHEVAHAMALEKNWDPTVGYHAREGTGVMMQSAMTKKSGPARQFTDANRVDVRVK